MTLAPWSRDTLLWSSLFWLLCGYAAWNTYFIIPVVVLAIASQIFVLWFFRMPNPEVPQEEGLFVAPGEGVVSDIEEVERCEWIEEPCLRIGIFLSVFDVHVNRAPIAGKIAYGRYAPGKFLDARHPDATHANESNTIGMEFNEFGIEGKILLRQISGLIARRIICDKGVGAELSRGALFGMIKFGSRTELYIPKSIQVECLVEIGDKVRCGSSPILKIMKAEIESS